MNTESSLARRINFPGENVTDTHVEPPTSPLLEVAFVEGLEAILEAEHAAHDDLGIVLK
jgi:hypothetical protein